MHEQTDKQRCDGWVWTVLVTRLSMHECTTSFQLLVVVKLCLVWLLICEFPHM